MNGADLLEIITAEMHAAAQGTIGVAVSGGGDSVALLSLMDLWAHQTGRRIEAVTVDHGLRPASAAEAAGVAKFCTDLGVPHETLNWQDWDGQGNLQNAARTARRDLISNWAQRRNIETVVTGHTQDDQAETFLMRLARGSGVDGLAAIHPRSQVNGISWVRPMLGVNRSALRDYLSHKNITWVDDPSNNDPRFDRIKFRQKMAVLADLGLGVDVLADTAARMQRARGALEQATLDLANAAATPGESGSVSLDQTALRLAPEEIQLRLLAHAIGWVATSPYRPRLHSLQRVLEKAKSTTVQTLAGCVIQSRNAKIEICREANAVKESHSLTQLFDGRWQLTCALQKTPVTLRILGEDGILLRPKWRQSAESRFTILSSPSIWYNNELMSVPLLDKDGPCTCRLIAGVHSFFVSILTH